MDLNPLKKNPRQIVLAGMGPERAREFRAALQQEAEILTIGESDTLTPELLDVVDLVIFDLAATDSLVHRFANLAGDSPRHCQMLALGVEEIPEEIRERLPHLRLLPAQIDYSYIRGILDSAFLGRARMKRLDEEQSRVRALYEISSSLLKVANRESMTPALENTLPKLLDARMILLVFPADSHPIFYIHNPEGFTESLVDAMRVHLKEAWDVLRSDFDVGWDWFGKLPRSSDPDFEDTKITSSSFITTPISSGARTEGFLTVLPKAHKTLNEAFLQTFFVIGDLISVLLHSLDLRDRLEERAMHDGLTRLLNRQTLIEYLEHECKRSQRHDNPVCVVMMDIDHFKLINDRHGHQAGDEVLRVVAQRLRNSIRDVDFVGRCGGEEFIAVLVNTDLEGGGVWAERFRRQLAADSITFLQKSIQITASLGVAVGAGDEAIVDRIIGRADAALYEAKHRGRNAVVLDGKMEVSEIPVDT